MFYQSTLSEFNRQLYEIQNENTDYLDQANLGCEMCTRTLDILRKEVIEKGFKTKEREIHFFKHIKIEPMRYLIYYTEIRSCELRIPKTGKKYQLKYLEKQNEKVNSFLERHTEFLLYMKQGFSHLDEHYFTRKHLGSMPIVKSYPYYKDTMFNTSYDEILARINGLALYVKYLNTKKEDLELIKKIDPSKKETNNITWTGSYSAFVEMMYGCHAMGYFNNGNTSINQIIEMFGDFLNVKKGNSSRTYYEIKGRKGSRIKFFEEAGQKLLDKMEEEDGLDS